MRTLDHLPTDTARSHGRAVVRSVNAVFIAFALLFALPSFGVPGSEDEAVTALCATAEGQLSMMLAKVVVTTPAAPTVSTTNAHTIVFNSELFKVAQPEATNSSCQNSIAIELYLATTSAALSNLQTAAANDATDLLATPAGVTKLTVSSTRSGNILSCTVNIGRNKLPTGANFYRISKRIAKEGGEDPYVFSSTFSFTVVNMSPVANAGADKIVTLPATTVILSGSATDDVSISWYAWTQVNGAASTIGSPSTASTLISGLVAGAYTFRLRATDGEKGGAGTDDVLVTVQAAVDPTPRPDLRADGVSQPLYGGGNGSVGDGTFTYYKLPDNFCNSLPPLTSYIQDGQLGSAFSGVADKRIMRLNHPLPNMAIQYTNIGTAATGAGFTVQVLKGTGTTALASVAGVALAAGAQGSVNYANRGTAVVYRFPGFDGTEDLRLCYVREELDHTFNAVFTKEKDGITINIDSGNAITTDPNRTNNKKFIAAGTTVVVR